MEGRRSRCKSVGVELGDNMHVSSLRTKVAAKIKNSHANIVEDNLYDRVLPKVGGENKRRRAPRGLIGRSLKAKVEFVIDDDPKIDVFQVVNEDVSRSHSDVNQHSHVEDQVFHQDEDENGDNCNNGLLKEHGVKRRGSSRPRIRPSKFQEGLSISFTKMNGELKFCDNNARVFEVVLPINSYISPIMKSREGNKISAPSLHADFMDLAATNPRINNGVKEERTSIKEKEISMAAHVVQESPKNIGLQVTLSALKRIMKMKEADPFNKPVDPVELGILDYLEIVKRPMDLGTIRNRLEKGGVYNTVEDVFEDVALVWSNCRKYNDDGDPIMEFLHTLESTFNKLCLAAGFPSHVANAGEANSIQQKGGELHEEKEDQIKISKKKKAKIVSPEAGVLLKTKIKRSAPVDRIMAESKAREQMVKGEGVNLGAQDRDVKNAVESSEVVDKQLEISQNEQAFANEENHDDDAEPLQVPVATHPMKAQESTPTRPQRRAATLRHATVPVKTRRLDREAKARKSAGGAHSKASRIAMKKSGGPNGDLEGDAEEEVTGTEDSEDALYGYPHPDNSQGCFSTNYQLPLRKLDPSIVEMSRMLLGRKVGSIWNSPALLAM